MAALIAIGSSAGGVRALQRIAAALPGDFPAALLVALHIGSRESLLPKVLSATGPLPATPARDGEAIEPGRWYIAPPGHHLLVEGNALRLNRARHVGTRTRAPADRRSDRRTDVNP